MKPLQVAFIAVLKPIQDIRLFHKLAFCWLELGFKVHLFGFQNPTDPQPKNTENIFFYPIFRNYRLHWSRLLVGYRLLWYLLKIRPQMVVCAAVEMLPFCLFYKFLSFLCFRKVHLSYDVQENYVANVLFTRTYPRAIRILLAKFLRFCEWLCSYWIDIFFLAEKCYVQELPFLSEKKYLVLENKFLQKYLLPKNAPQSSKISFLHSGTLAREYGTEKILEIINLLSKQNIDYDFLIAGKCSDEKLYAQIQNLSSENFFVQISASPIAYKDILLTYREANIVLMPYQINEAYKNRIPTKFYEAMAHNAWIWVQKNPAWQVFFEEYDYKKVVFTDFWSEKIDFSFLEKIHFSFDKTYSNPNIFWETERKKIFIWLQSLDLLQKSSKKS